MKTITKITALLLLIVNGIGALYGGFHLIADPSGAGLQMPLSFLEHSPFQSYLIPGIILLIVNGILSFVAIGAVILKPRYYSWFIIIQGIILTGWIIVQVILLRLFYAPMHATFLAVGGLLIGCGLFLGDSRRQISDGAPDSELEN
jgi:hypothetical protein